jgi:hypothetical protein
MPTHVVWLGQGYRQGFLAEDSAKMSHSGAQLVSKSPSPGCRGRRVIAVDVPQKIDILVQSRFAHRQ